MRSVLSLQYEIHVLQATNAAKTWQRHFALVRFLAGYSSLYCRAGLVWLKNEGRAKLRRGSIQAPPPCNHPSRVCVLELLAPMGHYGSLVHTPPIPRDVTHKVDNRDDCSEERQLRALRRFLARISQKKRSVTVMSTAPGCPKTKAKLQFR